MVKNLELKRWWVLIAGLAIGGCASNMPEAQNFPPAQQKIALATRHWGVIATDAVEQSRATLDQELASKDIAVYVAENSTSEFSKAFRNFMISGLLKAGIPVSDKKEGAIEITYETQVISHKSRGKVFDPGANGYRTGTLAGTASGYWVLRNATLDWIAASTVAAAGGYDYFRQDHPEPTGVEMLLTTSIVRNGRYLVRNTDAYYVEDADISLFDPCRGKSRRNCR